MDSVAARLAFYFVVILGGAIGSSVAVAAMFFGSGIANVNDFSLVVWYGAVSGMVGFVLTAGPVVCVLAEHGRRGAIIYVALIWSAMSFFFFLLEYARYLAT